MPRVTACSITCSDSVFSRIKSRLVYWALKTLLRSHRPSQFNQISYQPQQKLSATLLLIPQLCSICFPLLLTFSPTWNASPSCLPSSNPLLSGWFSLTRSVENSARKVMESGERPRIRNAERGGIKGRNAVVMVGMPLGARRTQASSH